MLLAGPLRPNRRHGCPTRCTTRRTCSTPRRLNNFRNAIDKAAGRPRRHLWVATVQHLRDDLTAEKWAQQTIISSDLGFRDVLLAVATGSRSYYFDSPEAIDDITRDDLKSIASDKIVPALRKDEWLGAGMGTVDGLAGTDHSSNAGRSPASSVAWQCSAAARCCTRAGSDANESTTASTPSASRN